MAHRPSYLKPNMQSGAGGSLGLAHRLRPSFAQCAPTPTRHRQRVLSTSHLHLVCPTKIYEDTLALCKLVQNWILQRRKKASCTYNRSWTGKRSNYIIRRIQLVLSIRTNNSTLHSIRHGLCNPRIAQSLLVCSRADLSDCTWVYIRRQTYLCQEHSLPHQ